MINIGDYVTRKSYNNDIIFKIVDIKGETYYLCGVSVRLSADSPVSDLVLCDREAVKDDFSVEFNEYQTLDRHEYFYLPGRVLHIDGDKDGIYSLESDLPLHIYEYLEKYNPDILVITGHDSMYKRKRSSGSYKNTDNFVKAVHEARRFEKSHEKLLIIAGACQSNYEELIKAGANFASSPKRINIHALDPAIVASSLSFSDKNNNIDLIHILDKTKYGADGMGGIITKGTMYVGYPRE